MSSLSPVPHVPPHSTPHYQFSIIPNPHRRSSAMDLICPQNPKVWDGNGFSACFENMVLGFGANIITVAAVLVLAFTRRHAGRFLDMRINLLAKVFLHMIPLLEALLSFYEMYLLLKNSLQGSITEYHEWFLRCSQFVSWMIIVLLLRFQFWFLVLCNPVLCFWWILKPVLEIPHMLTVFSSVEALARFKETFSVSAEIMFCLIVNIVRATRASTLKRKPDSLEDPLISWDTQIYDPHVIDLDCKFGYYWDLLTFKFVNAMMDLGVAKQLDFGDLVQLSCDLLPSSCYYTILRCWVTEQNEHNSQPSLFRAICSAYGWPYLRLGVLKVFNDGIGFISPLLLNKLIRFLQQGSGHVDGYILALSLGLTSILKSFLDTQYSFHLLKLKLKLRASIMTLVYHKCLHISLAERSKFSDGEVQTFMSIDADRTVNLCNSFHDMWSLPLQICVALYLLYTQVNFAFVSGIAIIIMLIPVNKWISTMIATATVKMMKQKDERIRSAGEILTYIRTLKMYSWENLFTERLMKIREMEVKHLSTRKYLDAWCVFFWATTPTVFSLFTFGVFTLMGHPLNAATAFTCVALFNTLISPLNSFPWVINGLIDAIISSRRLSKFLSCPEHSSSKQPSDGKLYKTNLPPCHSNTQDGINANSMAVVFRDSSSVWSSSCEDNESTVLGGITLELPKGLLIAVIGEIGSGKSSLLNSILGEMRLSHGIIHSHGSISFVPQVPWLMSGSVRDNILFGEKINAERYQEVLHACALDIDISLMAGGDLAYVKEKGVNLSGGQRARIALARAVYRDSDIYLLDDVLSSVDSQVAYWILQKTILGPLMDSKTRVLCTHNPQAISAADMIVVMDKGHIKWSGSLSRFLSSPFSAIFSLGEQTLASSLLDNENSTCSSSRINSIPAIEINCESVSEVEDTADIELRKEGRVEFSVYKGYATFSSWPIVILICLSAFFMQASRNGSDLWLSHWVDAATATDDTIYYLVVFSIFSAANSFLTLVRAFSFSYGGLRAAVQVHTELLLKLVNAPVHFFDQNPSGRILNRLSSDLYAIDDSLPFILNILLANFLNLLGIAIILSYSQIFFLLLLFPFGYIFRKLQLYYRSTSRELRRLDSIARSPIYSSFTESLDGSSTIRALETEELFMTRFIEHVASYQRTSYSESTASLWLSLRLQLLAASVIFFIAAMAILGCRGDFPLALGTPGLVGLALSNAAPMVSLLSNFLTSFTETEKEMVSVERVLQYVDIPQEELQGSQYMPPDWPLQGDIEFEHVTLKYKPSLPAALNNLSFKIATGMQVGIVGRTGAGKSSIINALFRLTPISSGRILVDGVDVAGFSVGDLRRHLAVVPQSPFLFEGSLRENLDPYANTSDAKIWEALEKCHVKSDVETSGGLSVRVKEGGISFSVGQRQLICLARALIKSSKILCLDECTANVDTQTASVLQKTISAECQGMTVLTIAHRISVVTNMDSVLVLDQGVLIEQGNPQVLLKDGFSRFSSFARASTL